MTKLISIDLAQSKYFLKVSYFVLKIYLSKIFNFCSSIRIKELIKSINTLFDRKERYFQIT